MRASRQSTGSASSNGQDAASSVLSLATEGGRDGARAAATAGNNETATDGQGRKKRRRRPSSETTAEPKKKKGKYRKPFSLSKAERRQQGEQMKTEYLEKRAELEKELDEGYKKHFGAIAFSRWKKDPVRPVVLLGPYSVPPPLRATWMKMYESTKGDPTRMWYYCFWYGDPLNEAYSYAKVKDVTLYEVAEKLGTHKLGKRIVTKLEKGLKLSKMEQRVYAGFKVLDEELKKERVDRVPEHFKEEHQVLLDCESDESDDDVCLDGDDQVSFDDSGSEGCDEEGSVGDQKPATKLTSHRPAAHGRGGEKTPAIRKALVGEEVDMRESECSEGDSDQDSMKEKSSNEQGDIGTTVPEIKQAAQNVSKADLKEFKREISSTVNVLSKNVRKLTQDTASHEAAIKHELARLNASVTTAMKNVESTVQNTAKTTLEQLTELSSTVKVFTSDVKKLTKDTPSHEAAVKQEVTRLNSSLTIVTSRVESIGSSISELTSKVGDLSQTLRRLADRIPHSAIKTSESGDES